MEPGHFPTDAVELCTGCGRRRAADDRFCGGCGRSFADPETALVAPAATPTTPAIPSELFVPASARLVPAPRPWWPWLLVAGGLFVACLYGARTYAAYQVVQRVEASTAARVTQGIGGLLALLRMPNVAAPFDPRTSIIYVQARQEIAAGAITGGVGAATVLLGLIILAVWRPGYVPMGAARPATAPASVSGGLVLLGIVAGLYLGVRASDVDLSVVAQQAPGLAPAGAVGPAVVGGSEAPVGQRPVLSPTGTPAAVFYRGAPYGPVKIEPGQVQPVRLPLGANTLVRATVTIAFNNRLSGVSGVPDLDITVSGPQGVLETYPQVRNGFQLSFQAPTAGDYTIVLSNARSRVNAKQVSIQFLQP